MGGEVSTDFKSSNGIEISWLVQVLWILTDSRGPPLGDGGGWMWVGGGERVPPHMHTCTCIHACTCTCTRVWHHREFPGIPPMGAAICMKLSCLPRVRVHACMHIHVCACVCMCVGAPPNLPTPIHSPQLPPPHHPTPQSQSHREPKTPKFNKSWTNRDNSILFEDSLPLNISELI